MMAEILGYTLAELEPINGDTWLKKFAHPDDNSEAVEDSNLFLNKSGLLRNGGSFETQIRATGFGRWIMAKC
jgi:hypothetical protein